MRLDTQRIEMTNGEREKRENENVKKARSLFSLGDFKFEKEGENGEGGCQYSLYNNEEQ